MACGLEFEREMEIEIFYKGAKIGKKRVIVPTRSQAGSARPDG